MEHPAWRGDFFLCWLCAKQNLSEVKGWSYFFLFAEDHTVRAR